jgi:putative ABC transport system permease protein
LLALLVSALGIYSSISYAVNQRINEFGVRVALGASFGRIVWHVTRRALTPVVIGVTIGVAIALLATRFISSLLYGVSVTDPFIGAGVATVLFAVAAVASLPAACRAANVDPVRVITAD